MLQHKEEQEEFELIKNELKKMTKERNTLKFELEELRLEKQELELAYETKVCKIILYKYESRDLNEKLNEKIQKVKYHKK